MTYRASFAALPKTQACRISRSSSGGRSANTGHFPTSSILLSCEMRRKHSEIDVNTSHPETLTENIYRTKVGNEGKGLNGKIRIKKTVFNMC